MSNTTNTLKKTAVSKKTSVKKVIYLDNHATTPIDPRVLEAMLPFFQEDFGNPASTHYYGLRASFAVDQARLKVARAIGAEEDEIFFTSGATESNNTVLKGIFEHFRSRQPHFIVSAIEHKCILEAAKHIEKQGAQVTFLKVNPEGIVESEQLKKAIRANTVLVSLMFANNEIGSINPIHELSKICRDKGILFHTDAAQAVGKIPIDVKELGIDLLSASGHKFYGPKGVGFLYVRKQVQNLLTPLLDGGGQENGIRSGTLNVTGIVGIGKAIELAIVNMEEDFWHYIKLRNQLYEKLLRCTSELLLNGPIIDSATTLRKIGNLNKISSGLRRLPNNLNVTIPYIQASELQKQMTRIAFSSGSACSSADFEPSYVLTSIGRTKDQALVSLRFGIGRFNTEQDVRIAADSLAVAFQPIDS